MTDLLTVLPHLDTSSFSHILPSLERTSISTADLLSLEPLDLAKRAQVAAKELHRLSQAILQNLQEQYTERSAQAQGASTRLQRFAADSLHEEDTICCLEDCSTHGTTPLRIPTGCLIEVTGESGSGKTQWLLSLLLAVQLPRPFGLNRAALYVSTEAPLQTSRLSQILALHPFIGSLATNKRPSLTRVLSIQTQDIESQEHILRYQLPVAIKRYDIGLVVVDSVTANFRAEFDNDGSALTGGAMARRSAQLVELGALLRAIAREHNVALCVANQVADRFDLQVLESEELTPSRNLVSSANQRMLDPELEKHHEQQERPSYEIMNLDHQQRWFTGWGDELPDAAASGQKTPSLGLIWTNQLDARIALVKRNRTAAAKMRDVDTIVREWDRYRKVVFASWTRGATGGRGDRYFIDATGLVLFKKNN